MRGLTLVVIAAALSATPALFAKSKPKKPPVAATPATASPVSSVNLPDGLRTDLAFDGPLLGWVLPRSRGGARTLVVLVGPKRQPPDAETTKPCLTRETTPETPKSARLYRWRSELPDRLDAFGAGLPDGTLDAADLDGDGNEELLLHHDGRIDLVTTSSDGSLSTEMLVHDAALGRSCCGPQGAREGFTESDAGLRVAVLGAFRTYRHGSEEGVSLASEVGIPSRVSAGSALARVTSPAVQKIGRTSEGRMVFATEPEALGVRRLRTLLLDPDGPAESRVVESWALLPEPERVVDTGFSILDGAPVLVVTTISAEKLNVFGEKRLRLYPLSGNRTRAGDPPLFAATSGINLWQTVSSSVVDLDRDGREDLVLAYWKGLKNAIAALEIYRGGANPRFAKARSLTFDVEGGDKSFMDFGHDVDGDGRPDLVLRANTELQVFPGVDPTKAADKPVETRPSRRVALPSDFPSSGGTIVSMGTGGLAFSRNGGGLGTPHLVDIDGDGRPEAVFAGDGVGGAGRVSIVALRGWASPGVPPSSRGADPPGARAARMPRRLR